MSFLRTSTLGPLAVLSLLALAVPAGAGPAGAAETGEQVLQTVCASCHAALPGGGLARIAEMRKSPEGWEMTINRMVLAHGVTIGDADKAALVKYLSDKEGLAPGETTPYRAFLEHRPDAKDVVPNPELGEMCARCHSFARIGLQHRDTAEWVKHANFHLGQYPSIEYSDKGRDREWWRIASTEIPPLLGKMLPLTTPEWTAWQKHPAPALAGNWRVVGHTPGEGDYQGSMVLTATGGDKYDATLDLAYRDGRKLAAKGAVILYTGHEWRAELTAGQQTIRQVLELAEDGTAKGRWFDADHDEKGGDITAVREQPKSARVLAVSPSYLKAGETAEIEIDGIGLSGTPALGDGIKVVSTVSQAPGRIVVKATAAADAKDGARAVAVGPASLAGGLVVYHKIGAVRVEPADAIARVGGNGGPIAPVTAQFEAVGYLASADGDPAKAIRIGVFPATWSVTGFDAVANQEHDPQFAGQITANGEFQPAGAGPDPKRHFGTNNAGNLKVTGTVTDAGKPVAGDAHLIVTVQRWIKPDIL
jgi:quinohemoprotein amine dehydrogenase